MTSTRHLLLCAVMLLSFPAAAAPPDADGGSVFRPELYFAGRTRSQGVLETFGASRGVAVSGIGRRDRDGSLTLTQDIAFSDGERQRRVWRLHPLEAGRYEATANDVVGVGQGQVQGNVFRLRYTLVREPGNPSQTVDVEHEMTLEPDGRTMINRATYSKFGIGGARLTERLTREGGGTAGPRR